MTVTIRRWSFQRIQNKYDFWKTSLAFCITYDRIRNLSCYMWLYDPWLLQSGDVFFNQSNWLKIYPSNFRQNVRAHPRASPCVPKWQRRKSACSTYGHSCSHIEAETKCRKIPDDILKCIFVNENIKVSIKISLKFVPKGPINNIPALVQIMAWCRPGDKPLFEPMMVSLLTHICVTRPQWVN